MFRNISPTRSFLVSLCMLLAEMWCGTVQAIMFEGPGGMKPPQPSYFFSDQPSIGRAIAGEVLRIDGNDLFVTDESGNEVRLRVDDSTVKIGAIKEGDRIEARVNRDDYALSIRPVGPGQ